MDDVTMGNSQQPPRSCLWSSMFQTRCPKSTYQKDSPRLWPTNHNHRHLHTNFYISRYQYIYILTSHFSVRHEDMCKCCLPQQRETPAQMEERHCVLCPASHLTVVYTCAAPFRTISQSLLFPLAPFGKSGWEGLVARNQMDGGAEQWTQE